MLFFLSNFNFVFVPDILFDLLIVLNKVLIIGNARLLVPEIKYRTTLGRKV